jgi:rare lipoprotein A
LNIIYKTLFVAMALFVASFFDARSGIGEQEAEIATKNILAENFGRASWYGPGFIGRQTASGKIYEPDEVFVAHRSYPFGTILLVTNLQNHRTILVKVEDRGPYIPGRSLDFSEKAARELAMVRRGVISVAYEVIR